MKLVHVAALSLALLLAAAANATPIVTLQASATTVSTGGTVTLSWFVSGLTANGAPSVSAWDLELDFDPAVLTALSATYGDPVLGNQLDPVGTNPTIQITPILDNTGGLVSLGQFSVISPSDVDFFQPDAFILAQIVFQVGNTPGMTTISPCTPGVGLCLLGDALAQPLAFGMGPDLVLTIVPEPQLVILLLLGTSVVFRRIHARG